MNENYLMELGALVIFFALLLIGLWIWMMVYATKKKGLLGFLLTFFLGVIGWIIVVCLPADNKPEREREREREFRCGICYIKYRGELLGGETIREGKICRFCLEKKQKGEA